MPPQSPHIKMRFAPRSGAKREKRTANRRGINKSGTGKSSGERGLSDKIIVNCYLLTVNCNFCHLNVTNRDYL